MPKNPANLKKMNFETALEELESIVNKFESGQLSLEQAIKDYSYGIELKQHCEKKLSEAKLTIEKITSEK